MVKKNLASGNDKYGTQRVKLGNIVAEILTRHNIKWCIENGALLGAFRNNSLIVNDDDFDIALFFENKAIENLKVLHTILKNTLPDQYDVRIINTYCQKLEVYDKNSGNYILDGDHYNNANYHHVTVDLQAYELKNNNYERLYPHFFIKFPKNILFPFKTILLNNDTFPCPRETEIYLEMTYGYIGENAKYNPETKKYEPKSI